MSISPASLTLKDFQLRSEWQVESNEEKFVDGTPKYVIDKATERKYLNENDALIRLKFVLLITIGIPALHSLSLAGHLIYRIIKLVTASHFWAPKNGEINRSFTARLNDAGLDLLKIVVSPIVLIGLELASIYGLFKPLDGRKVFASLERFEFEKKFILGTCFQPDPTHHLFGGDINQRDAI